MCCFAALLLCCFVLPACTSGPGDHGSHPLYPTHLAQAETLDIQVTRDATRITLTNTTARSFGASRLWLNGAYGRDLEPLEIGETVTLDLSEFVDENGEPFKAGGFFAAERPDTLVLAQLEVEGRLLGLVVVQGEPG